MKTFLLLIIINLLFSSLEAQQWATQGSTNIYNTNTGYVGIGTGSSTAPSQPLSVMGTAQFNGSSSQTIGYTRISWNAVGGTGASTFDNHRDLGNTAFVFRSTTGTNAFTELMRIDASGNVGIGLTNPSMKLDVNGDIRSNRLSSGTLTPFFLDNFTYDSKTTYNYGLSWMTDSWNPGGATTWLSGWAGIKLFTSATPRLSINNSGNVGIGTTNPQSLLAVKGTLTAQKVVVTQAGWSDYVFDSSYQLLSLDAVKSFIQAKKHLPDVPSAEQIATNGNDLADNQRVLLQKVEELTLYLIEQNKQLQEQSSQIKYLKTELMKLQTGKHQSLHHQSNTEIIIQ